MASVRIVGARYIYATFLLGDAGDPGAIRTRDPQIRNLMLYPTELRDHGLNLSNVGDR